MNLPNETKIRFCNAMEALRKHANACHDCWPYLRWGDGDLCGEGAEIVARELVYADTQPDAK